MTLIELMVVLALVAMVVAGVARGMRSLARTDLRTSATKLSGAMRYLFDRASTTGRVHRLVIDLDAGRFWAEVSDGRVLQAHEREDDDARKKELEKLAEEITAAKAKEESAASESRASSVSLAAYQPEEFKPKRAKFDAFKETAVRPVTLSTKVQVTSVFTPRLADPLSSGKGYVYFFPLGQTEAAYVHLREKHSDAFYTLILHPLTGKVQIHNSYVEPPVREQFDDEGNRIEIGGGKL